MLAALVILPAMGVGGVTPDTAGPGLMFVYLVNVLNGMAGGRVVGMLFFICVLFAGETSIVNLYEVPVAFLQEKLGLRRVSAVAVIGLIGAVISVLIQPWTAQWMDAVSYTHLDVYKRQDLGTGGPCGISGLHRRSCGTAERAKAQISGGQRFQRAQR